MSYQWNSHLQKPLDSVALVDNTSRRSWRELILDVNRVANGLQDLSLAEGERVGVYSANRSEVLVAHLGTIFAGYPTVPINSHLKSEEVGYILSDAAIRVLFVDEVTAPEAIVAACGQAREITIIGWDCHEYSGPIPYELWLARSSDRDPDFSIAPKPPVFYTSGTTGFPKGVVAPPGLFPRSHSLDGFLEAVISDQMTDFAVNLVVGPLYHVGPFASVRTLAAGRAVVVLNRFSPEDVLAAIEREGVESASMVPTHFRRLLALPEEIRRQYDLSSLKRVLHTGSKCPSDVKREMIDWFGPILVEVYGGTELGVLTAIDSEEWLERPGSVGRPVEPFECVVLGDDFSLQLPGQAGLLYFRHPSRSRIEYLNSDAVFDGHAVDGLVTLGDIGYTDAEGYVFVTDRSSDMVVSGGVNVYPAEVERVMSDHPAVADVAVIGIPDPEMGEKLLACVVLDSDDPDDDLIDDIIAYCKRRMAGFKCPRTITVCESLPRNDMGKLEKWRLRRPY